MRRRIVVAVFGPSKVGSIGCAAVYCLLFAWTTVLVLAGEIVPALPPGLLTLLWMMVLLVRFSITKTARDKVIAYAGLATFFGAPFLCAGVAWAFDRLAQNRAIPVLRAQIGGPNGCPSAWYTGNTAIGGGPGRPRSRKVIPIYAGVLTPRLDEQLYRALPSSIRASTVDEVGAVAWATCAERTAGWYTGGGGNAYEIGCNVELIDLVDGRSFNSEEFVSHTAPNSRVFGGEYHGRDEPVEAMQTFIWDRLREAGWPLPAHPLRL